MLAPEGVVLLAAGAGSRLHPLTHNCHKSLLPIADKPALKWIIDPILDAGVKDIVVVTGHRHEDIASFLRREYPATVRCVFNDHYKADTNIFSVHLGVNALVNSSAGYMIVETDMVIDPRGWDQILNTHDRTQSYWVTRGRYSASLTGGALRADAQGRVTDLLYRPQYDPACEGWPKLLGILYVGSALAAVDQSIRHAAINSSLAQYYMMPWVANLSRLPCLVRDLADVYGASYNDVEAYQQADKEFRRIQGLRGY